MLSAHTAKSIAHPLSLNHINIRKNEIGHKRSIAFFLIPSNNEQWIWKPNWMADLQFVRWSPACDGQNNLYTQLSLNIMDCRTWKELGHPLLAMLMNIEMHGRKTNYRIDIEWYFYRLNLWMNNTNREQNTEN